jgi:hypothetical protein
LFCVTLLLLTFSHTFTRADDDDDGCHMK